jgi:parallel beta-helix repeat protein
MRQELKKPKNIISIIFIILSISGLIYLLSYYINSVENPILINIYGDIEFENYDFIGDGSIEHPYIIEWRSIRLPENALFEERETAITIEWVTKNFIIRNNNIRLGNQGSGIYLNQISGNFIIEHNVFIGTNQYTSRAAISLTNIESDFAVVSSNKISTSDGFYFKDCQNLQVVNNTLQTIGFTKINFCSNCTFSGNFVKDSVDPIEVYQCPNMMIEGNTFTNTIGSYTYFSYDYESIWIHSPNVTIRNNIFELTGLGFSIQYAQSYIIENNMVNGKPLGYFYNQTHLVLSDYDYYGQIIMVCCNYSTIEHQKIEGTTSPIRLAGCLNCTFFNCTFLNNGVNGYIESSKNITLLQCTIKNSEIGLWISGSTVYLTKNLFQNLDDLMHIGSSTLYMSDNVIIL